MNPISRFLPLENSNKKNECKRRVCLCLVNYLRNIDCEYDAAKTEDRIRQISKLESESLWRQRLQAIYHPISYNSKISKYDKPSSTSTDVTIAGVAI